MNHEEERKGRNRVLERSLSYSEAVGNGSGRSSFEIPAMIDTEIYTNEEIKKHYRISQSYVEGKEISFPMVTTNFETNDNVPYTIDGSQSSQYSSEDETTDGGLVMTIDVDTDYTDSPKTSDTRNISTMSTRPMVSSNDTNEAFDRIELMESIYYNSTTSPSTNYTKTSYSKRKKKTNRQRQQPGRPMRSKRAVWKNGEENVPVRINIPAKSMKYMRDIVNTVINSKWRFIILLMFVSYFAFWLLFAAIWYAVTSSYQDDIGDGKEHCVTGTSSFAGMLMMAVETQMTIGYGVRYPNEECPEAIIIMVLEIVAGTALSGGLTSLLFTKLVRPNKHVSSVGFSKKAAVCLRDGELCLQFRVWDMLSLHMIGSTLTAYMLKPIRTLEGEMMQNYIHKLELKQARAFLLWPITVVHVIDAESPLYHFSAQDMIDYRFEIVVSLTGSARSMGTMTQSRTSYLSKEIIWGYRFKNVLNYSKRHESYVIDVDNLNSVEQVDTPLCSASRLKEFEVDIKLSNNILSTSTNIHSTSTNVLTSSVNVLSSSTNISVTPTEPSLIQDDTSTLSNAEESVPSTPNLDRTGTQKSFGWNFKRFLPEKNMRKERIEKEKSNII